MRSSMHSKLAAFEGVVRLVDWVKMGGRRRREMMVKVRWDGGIMVDGVVFGWAWLPPKREFSVRCHWKNGGLGVSEGR